MALDPRVAAVVLLVFSGISAVLGQTSSRCHYMTDAIPREPKPADFVEFDWNGEWNDYPLLPATPRDDVCIDSYNPPTGSASIGTTIIHMEESIQGDVYIAKLNYQGSETPEIAVPMLAGQFDLLGPEIRNENGDWHLVITRTQDYETPVMRRYTFDIRVADQTLTARVSLSIENIDDNAPIMRVLDACVVPELGEPRLTDCVYDVSDADGRLSIEPMRFEIDSDRGDDETFRIAPQYISGDWFNMRITLGLNTALNFETNPLHIFQITAYDSWPNTQTVTVMVQVENVEHRPPRWVEIFAVQQFDEKTYQNFTVRAIDGDTGIDKPIYYRLEKDEADDFFSIVTIEGGRDGAIFYVTPIDRDTLERDIFTLSIIAYKFDNETFATEASIVIIVNDINDQKPEPLFEEYFIEILEETALTLNFDKEFGFHDRDQGVNAQYEVHIESEYPPGAETAFYIAPEVGYQRQTFIMGTFNHSMLDYEDPPFQNITLQVIATDMDNPEFIGVARVYINLINWNDEEPIFENTTYIANFDETEGAGFPVATVRAYDRDIGDRVVHTLMGNAGNYLRIDNYTGEIFVAIDDAFDYHRQNELFVQIRADDTLMEPFHTTTSQLTIQLNDINNTPPTLRMPRGSPSVQENVPAGYEFDEEIIATDPDTTAYLQFEIDWDTSYATKQGREADPVEYHGCIFIETVFPNPDQTGSAFGKVVVQEIRPNVTIDFEEFEVLYLTVRVRDLNTTIGEDYDESTFTIIIIDMNDNPPIWSEGTLEQNFRVRERSGSDVVIGSVLATDIDGPLYNQVRYTIFPREDTPENLVKINFYTGQITVDEESAIDADIPPRWNLYYTIIASDRCYAEDQSECPPDPHYWDTPGNITIEIIDINNQYPILDTSRYNETVYIYENAPNGAEVVTLWANDADRDEMYNQVSFSINYAVNARLRDFFSVNRTTGKVYVDYQTNDVLDRDGDEPEHRIFLTIQDNFFLQGDGNSNQNTTEILIVLLDENDNAPELPPPSELSWIGDNSVSESLLEGIRLRPDIYAPDRDEPNTPNSHVGYAILDLQVTDRDVEVPRLFNMISINNLTGELETAMDLRGYWGTYAIHILAFDHGIPQQLSNETYELEVRPYNFHAPVFVWPISGTTVRLARERATAANNAILVKVNGDTLDSISATDEDGLHAGAVTFQVSGDANAENYFTVSNNNDNVGTLLLKQELPSSEDILEFQVTIRGTDGGTEPGPLFTESTLNVIFVPTTGDPIFTSNAYTVSFIEREVGLTESFQLPLAEDPKNFGCTAGADCRDIFYRIFDGNNDGKFALDPEKNIISLNSELDRNETDTYVLTIAASNIIDATALPLPGARLTVTVNVREANPRPYLERNLYTAGIASSDAIGRELVTFYAMHTEGATITYSIDYDTMVVDETLEAVSRSAFTLNPQSGVLTLSFQPTVAMHGMFVFNVVATDPAGESDTAEVRVYLISTRNRATFIFVNTVEQVENERNFIEQTFSKGFNLTCNLDQVLPATNSSGLPREDQTEVRAHFIQDDMPVEAEDIEDLRSNGQLLQSIQFDLSARSLSLLDFVTDISPDLTTANVQITIYVLAALCFILAFMCLILLLTYIIRTRALNHRLEALSMTKYGSVSSGLNRAGLIAPGTNKHAVEGSNPIWNEKIKAPDFDAISDNSDDSDLIGIEDMPQFRSDYFPPEDNISTQGIIADRLSSFQPKGKPVPIADSSNNFGFNTSPFSVDFTNKQFRP